MRFEPTTCPEGHTAPYPLHYVMHVTSPGLSLWNWNMRKGQWICVKSKLNIHYCKCRQFENCGLLNIYLLVYSPLIAFLVFHPPKKLLWKALLLNWIENWFKLKWTLQSLCVEKKPLFQQSLTFQQFTMVAIKCHFYNNILDFYLFVWVLTQVSSSVKSFKVAEKVYSCRL